MREKDHPAIRRRPLLGLGKHISLISHCHRVCEIERSKLPIQLLAAILAQPVKNDE
jgi:hypothetical protein